MEFVISGAWTDNSNYMYSLKKNICQDSEVSNKTYHHTKVEFY